MKLKKNVGDLSGFFFDSSNYLTILFFFISESNQKYSRMYNLHKVLGRNKKKLEII